MSLPRLNNVSTVLPLTALNPAILSPILLYKYKTLRTSSSQTLRSHVTALITPQQNSGKHTKFNLKNHYPTFSTNYDKDARTCLFEAKVGRDNLPLGQPLLTRRNRFLADDLKMIKEPENCFLGESIRLRGVPQKSRWL